MIPYRHEEGAMKVGAYRFGSITIRGVTYHTDVVIDQGTVRKRKKGPSKKYQEKYGHTPLTAAEELPWEGRQLIIGTGALGQLPIREDVYEEARRRGVEIVVLPTGEAVRSLREKKSAEANAVLHLTC